MNSACFRVLLPCGGIVETVINIQGIWHDADATLLSEMQSIEEKRKDGG
ncbi:MAG: hypothetical protein IS860_10860, partial [Nitrosopumilus sp.]|nr:hypothetical protein [Nitrosopumilus sp.]